MATNLAVLTYDPKKTVVTWGGVIVTGFADGSFISMTRSGDVFEKRKGADGSVDRINKNANDFTVQLTIMQTSPTNDALSALLLVDQSLNTSVLPLTVKDLSGTTLFFAPQAWIQKDPDDEFSDSLGSRQWTFATGIASKYTGGNLL